MLRILEIKRLFGLVQLMLVLTNICVLVFFVFLIYTYNPNKSLSSSVAGSRVADNGIGTPDLPKVDVESTSQKLLGLGLFGNAGKWNEEEVAKAPEEPPAPPESEDSIEDTQLNLKLIGTIALSPKDKFASACIENQDKRLTAFYAVGQEVIENVILDEVYPKEVILLNKRTNPPRRERLKIEDKSDALLKKPEESTSERIKVGKGEEVPILQNVKEIEVNREEIEREFIASYADLVTRIKPEMYRDETGKVVGVTARNIGDIPLAKKLGLKDGDVLVAVNDEKIDSEDKIIDIIRKYSDPTLPSIKITVLRDGKPMDVIYKIQ